MKKVISLASLMFVLITFIFAASPSNTLAQTCPTTPCPAGQVCTNGVCQTSGQTTSAQCDTTKPCPAGQQCINGVCQTSGQSTSPTPSSTPTTVTPFTNPLKGVNDVGDLVVKILAYAFNFLGIIAVVIIVYGGVMYLISAGSEERVKLGKSAITYGIIGLIIAILARVIVEFVIKAIGA